MTVVRCGGAPLPPVLVDARRVTVDAVPTKEQVDELRGTLPDDNRLIVCGTDTALAAILTRFLRTDTLDAEFAFVSDVTSPATRAWGLPTGGRAAQLGLDGDPRPVPLLRDDTGTAVVGQVRVTGVDGAQLEGEAYADDERVFSGTVPHLTVVPGPAGPGALVTDGRRHGVLRRRITHRARAVQLGTPGASVERDGVTGRRPVKRASFYRHAEPWSLVLP